MGGEDQPQDEWDDPTEITQDLAPPPSARPVAGEPAFALSVEDDEADSSIQDDEGDSLVELGEDDLIMLEDMDEAPLGALRDLSNGNSYLLVEERTVLGGDGTIPVRGSVLERAAEIVQVDEGYQLRRLARREVLKVNGRAVDVRHLEPGDHIEVARANFQYTLA
jgi:hypothetical protein